MAQFRDKITCRNFIIAHIKAHHQRNDYHFYDAQSSLMIEVPQKLAKLPLLLYIKVVEVGLEPTTQFPLAN